MLQELTFSQPIKRVHVRVGKELFGQGHEGKIAVLVRALHGLKTSSAAWHIYFASFLKDHIFRSSMVDPDVWLKTDTKKDNEQYYSYIIVYVENILVVSEHPRKYVELVNNAFPLKQEKIKFPNLYLGTDIQKCETLSGTHCIATSAIGYTKEAIRIIESHMKGNSWRFTSNGKQPLSTSSYQAELDSTTTYNDKKHSIYQNIMGI